VRKHCGELPDSALAPKVMATVHPLAILRAPGDRTRLMRQRFVDGLRKLAAALGSSRALQAR
jgi:hypothetical protein